MENDTTVIICCAGMGTRLGIGTTKSLLDINGKPLIIRQLELLNNFDDVRLVVGYEAEKLINVVKEYRKDIMFAFNYDYEHNGPGASVSKGLINTKKYVLLLDGDLLLNKDDFQRISKLDGEYIAISKKISSEPICIKVDENNAISFCKDSNYEWPGIIKIEKSKIIKSDNHVYDMIKDCFPIKKELIRVIDIDTPEDYELAIEWDNNGCK